MQVKLFISSFSFSQLHLKLYVFIIDSFYLHLFDDKDNMPLSINGSIACFMWYIVYFTYLHNLH
jgi:hypothetical protein